VRRMGIGLIVEVFDHAPAELTAQERLLLLALAEMARDETRMCCAQRPRHRLPAAVFPST
jgi:hypothetical protein